MDLKSYFEKTKGFGVISTADKDGRVDSAVFSRPHVMDDGSIAFIMNDNLTHHNLQSNPRAAYLFKETADSYKGKRFFLTKISEEKNSKLLTQLKRRSYPVDKDLKVSRFLVFFKIEKELPLIGPGEEVD